jgi:hypothetical protein
MMAAENTKHQYPCSKEISISKSKKFQILKFQVPGPSAFTNLREFFCERWRMEECVIRQGEASGRK